MVISELFTKDSNVRKLLGGHSLNLEKPGCIRQ